MKSVDNKLKNAARLISEAQRDIVSVLKKKRGRERGPLNKRLHDIQSQFGIGQTYYSQAGQDRFVDKIFGQKTGGVFADIGGYDGVTGSNTLFFERSRGWKGILAEAAPSFFEAAQKARSCTCLPVAVGGSSGQSEFLEVLSGYTQMSGFLESYNPSYLESVRAHPDHSEKIHKLEKKTLADLLSSENLTQVDYLSLDVEGQEMAILEGFEFSDFDIEILTIENNNASPELPKLMRDRGYELIEFLGVDDVFRKKR